MRFTELGGLSSTMIAAALDRDLSKVATELPTNSPRELDTIEQSAVPDPLERLAELFLAEALGTLLASSASITARGAWVRL
jgi:hypothetical protein